MTNTQRLVDEIRALEAKAAGKRIELCMALGDREGAKHWLKEMNAQTAARAAAMQSGCYFVEQGDAGRSALQKASNGR